MSKRNKYRLCFIIFSFRKMVMVVSRLVQVFIFIVIYVASFFHDMSVYQKYIEKSRGKEKKEQEYHDFVIIAFFQILFEAILNFRFLFLPGIVIPRILRLCIAIFFFFDKFKELFSINLYPFEISLEPAWYLVTVTYILIEINMSAFFYTQLDRWS